VGIAHYKPMFQFYKADCFMFEVRACIVGSTTRSQSSGARSNRDSTGRGTHGGVLTGGAARQVYFMLEKVSAHAPAAPPPR
jgi:hypothetical protein